MTTVALTASPATIDPGTAYELTVLNSGSTVVHVQIGGGSVYDQRLNPGQSVVVHPNGQAVTGFARSGTGQVDTTLATNPEPTVGSGTSLQAKRVASYQPTPFRGISRAAFYGLSLRNLSNLSLDGAGALIATTLLTVGTGKIDLPATLDPTLPFRFSAVVEVGVDDGGTLDLALGNGSDTNQGASWNVKGAGVTGYAPVNIAAGSLNVGMFSGQSLTAGLWELYAVSDGTRWQVGMKPLTTPALQTNGRAGLGNWVQGAENYRGGLNTDFNFTGSTVAWSLVSSLRIRNSSKTTKLRSVSFNQIGLAAPSVAQGAGFTMYPLVACAAPSLADVDVCLRGRGYDGRTPADLIVVGHPNASEKLTHNDKAVHTALLDAGFLLLYVQGDAAATLTGANSSDWGNGAGAATRKAALDWALSKFPQVRSVQWLGMSMGCLTGLAFHQAYPGVLRGLVGLSGVTNLSYGYSSESFKSVIDTAHGSSAVADVADKDPNLKPSTYLDLPMKFWHGSADTTVHKTNHADTFATQITAAGGTAPTVVNVAGGGHLDTAFWAGITPADVVAFFTANAAT